MNELEHCKAADKRSSKKSEWPAKPITKSGSSKPVTEPERSSKPKWSPESERSSKYSCIFRALKKGSF